MRDNICDTILVPGVGFGFIEQDRSCPVRDETPVLHGTHSLRKMVRLVRMSKTGCLTNS
jgi:hypothetical protein